MSKKDRIIQILGIMTSSILVIVLIFLLINVIQIENDPNSYNIENVINETKTNDNQGEDTSLANNQAEDRSGEQDTSRENQSEVSTDSNASDNHSSTDMEEIVSIYDATIDDLTETEIAEAMSFYDKRYPLVASIPDKDIYLYGANDGVILRQANNIIPFEWLYLTPRFILPRLWMEDFDDDGVEEILCVLYASSGTGVSIDELHILEPDEESIYRDIIFSSEDYVKQLEDAIQIEYSAKKNRFYYNISGVEYEAAAPFEVLNYTYKSTSYGNMLFFDYDDQIILNIAPEYSFTEMATPLYINSIIAKVNYHNESFTLFDMLISLAE